MIIHNIKQHTDEWKIIRAGKFTASTCNDLLMSSQNMGYIDLINRIAIERITGIPIENDYKSYDMIRGIELEDKAKKQFERKSFLKIVDIGFVELNEFVGMSPDGFIGDHSLIEIKCKKYNTHCRMLDRIEGIPKKDVLQMQFQLYVSKRTECIYYCYYPGIKPFIDKIKPDLEKFELIQNRLNEGIKEVKQKMKSLKYNE